MTNVTVAGHTTHATTDRLGHIARYQTWHRARLACKRAGCWALADFCTGRMKALLPTLKPAYAGPAQ